jgi:hypothetical protein
MDAHQRCENAIASGKFKTREAWCAAIIISNHTSIPPDWKAYARKRLDELVGNRAWLYLLAARRDSGERLNEVQYKCLRELHENNDKMV